MIHTQAHSEDFYCEFTFVTIIVSRLFTFVFAYQRIFNWEKIQQAQQVDSVCESLLFTISQKVMDAVIEIMYKAVVPWSDTIEKLVQQHLEREHPKYDLQATCKTFINTTKRFTISLFDFGC